LPGMIPPCGTSAERGAFSWNRMKIKV
jgi:hypothetical protein